MQCPVAWLVLSLSRPCAVASSLCNTTPPVEHTWLELLCMCACLVLALGSIVQPAKNNVCCFADLLDAMAATTNGLQPPPNSNQRGELSCLPLTQPFHVAPSLMSLPLSWWPQSHSSHALASRSANQAYALCQAHVLPAGMLSMAEA